MNILIICTFYPPDSAISAVRPYMLAKYLSRAGHNITVIRSGRFNKKPDDSLPRLKDVSVLSFLGSNCDAEKYDKGEYVYKEPLKMYSSIPLKMRKALSSIYHTVVQPFTAYKRITKAKANYRCQVGLIDSMNADKFDVVFSTYADLENIWAGYYASRVFHAKWIQDFRDPVREQPRIRSFFWNIITTKYQRFALKKADLCTCVSDGLKEEMNIVSSSSIKTLYNGYDSEDIGSFDFDVQDASQVLSFCYTGQIYKAQLKAFTEFLNCLQDLVNDESVDKSQICFRYAGPNSNEVKVYFSEAGLVDIFEDYGYVERKKARQLQNCSDVFIVLSWNTHSAQGVLTGKFFEGIRAEKPILSIVGGNKSNSELKLLNEKYHYGYCAEVCDKASIIGLKKYILSLYQQKTENRKISYTSNVGLKADFRYDNIAGRLLEYINELK